MIMTNNNTLLRFLIGFGCASLIGVMFSAQAEAAGRIINMIGKTVTWVIPFSAGGGTAEWANFYAPLLSDALPGRPMVTVKFMPGGGSTQGANWFQDHAEADGFTIFGSSGSTQFPYLLSDPRVKYEYNDWYIVLASGTGGVAYLPPDLGKKFKRDPHALKNINLIYGSQRATGLDLVPLLAWDMLGLNVRPIFGIKGRGDGRLMFEHGAANIDYQTSPSYLKNVAPLVAKGKVVPMMTWGILDSHGSIVRDPTFPNLPTFKETFIRMYRKAPSGAAWDAWKAFFIAGFSAQKMVFLPKGTEQDIIDIYMTAFDRIIAHNDFPRLSAKRLGKYPQRVGAEATMALRQGITIDASAKAYVINWLQRRYGVVLNQTVP